MRRVLIESPYSSGTTPSIPQVVARNVRYLRACLRDCVLRNETPYASHGLLTQDGVLCDEVAEERALGIEAGFVMRRVMDATVIYTDLGWSGGMLAGKADAEKFARRLPEDGINRHVIEERQLGGEWARCHAECSSFSSYIFRITRHAYQCPLWKPKV